MATEKASKELFEESWAYYRNAWKNIWKITGETAKLTANILAWTYKGIDATDKAIGKIWKPSTNKIIHFAKNNLIKILLAWSLLTYGWMKTHDYLSKDKATVKTEQVEKQKKLWDHPFEQHKLAFWDNNEEYFTENLALKKEALGPGVQIIRDAWLIFYIVQKWDNLDIIRKKLAKFTEFSYLSESQYDRKDPNTKTKSFNVPAANIQAGMYIPIPLNSDVREVSPQDFSNYCYDAIQDMKADSNWYAKELKEILWYTTEKELIIAMLAFARSETSEEYTNFTDPLGSTELHRREPAFKAFSFTFFHILMEKNSDGKTPGPWLNARLKLWLTEWQCYHPKNAAKLFLAYWIEKTNGNLKGIFPLTEQNIVKVGKMYNGSETYATKLGANYRYATKLLNGEIVYYDNSNLEKTWFIYRWLNNSYQHTYKFATPKGIYNNDDLKELIIKQFNKNKASDCPEIGEDDIVSKSWKAIEWKIVPDTVIIKIPKKK